MKTSRDFLAVRSKIPTRFPVAQICAAQKAAAHIFPPVGEQA